MRTYRFLFRSSIALRCAASTSALKTLTATPAYTSPVYGLMLNHSRHTSSALASRRNSNNNDNNNKKRRKQQQRVFIGFCWLAAWRSGNGVGRINEVTLRRARFVLGWVTCPGSTPGGGTLFRYVTSQPGRLSLSSFRGR